MRIRLVIAVLAMLLFVSGWSSFFYAQPRQDSPRGQTAKPNVPPSSEPRVALIIGNSAYKDSPLNNPVNDARDVATALAAFGFTVIHGENQTLVEMKKAVREFGAKLRQGGVGLFYFAGHGMQVKGNNYLIPIGAELNNEGEIESEAMNVNFILAQMEEAQNRLNIAILDACRNNPFVRGTRSGERGLASIDAPSGTLIAYATTPGRTASDGGGKNGLYTQELLASMRTPGLKVEEVFKRVRTSVRAKSKSQQIPWELSSLEGDFYFVPSANEPAKPPVSAASDHGNETASPPGARQEQVNVQTYTETINGVTIELARVPAGKYLLGSPYSEAGRTSNDWPQHEVTISQSFYMGKYEVTQAQWRAVTLLPKANKYLPPDPSKFKGDNLPVENVSWEEAVEFCVRLSQVTGKTYRLPTEAEWEYAARAKSPLPYGGNPDEKAWYGNNSGRLRLDADEIWDKDWDNYEKRLKDNGCQTHPVGTKKPNEFGLYDMQGNVWEWCMDWKGDYYGNEPRVDPTGPYSGEWKVVRGGDCYSPASRLRLAYRSYDLPGYSAERTGLRLVMVSN